MKTPRKQLYYGHRKEKPACVASLIRDWARKQHEKRWGIVLAGFWDSFGRGPSQHA